MELPREMLLELVAQLENARETRELTSVEERVVAEFKAAEERRARDAAAAEAGEHKVLLLWFISY